MQGLRFEFGDKKERSKPVFYKVLLFRQITLMVKKVYMRWPTLATIKKKLVGGR